MCSSDLAELKNTLEDGNTSDIKSKTDEVTQAFYKISEKIYENVNETTGEEASQSADEDVVDAEYEVVDEDEE